MPYKNSSQLFHCTFDHFTEVKTKHVTIVSINNKAFVPCQRNGSFVDKASKNKVFFFTRNFLKYFDFMKNVIFTTQVNQRLYSFAFQKKAAMIFFLTVSILLRMTMSQKCENNPDIALCSFEISAKPISHFALISKLGETLDSCVSSMKRSKIASGVYCKDIQFCGLSFDLTQDYTKQWNREVSAGKACLSSFSGQGKDFMR